MVLETSLRHYRSQQRLAAVAIAAARRAWRTGGPASMAAALAALQVIAARDGAASVALVLAEQNIDAPPVAKVNIAALAGVASDGRPLGSLLEQATTLPALELMAVTQVADASRVAAGVGVAVRDGIGYVRMLNPPSCSRCAILAGKWYEWNKGFSRHPRCDCRHVPTREDMAGDLRTDPNAYFRSLAPSEQDRVFTKAGAQAIRDGADLNQVVNARRGARGLAPAGGRLTAAEQRVLRGGREVGRLERTDVHGHDVFTTNEGVTRRGIAGRKLGAFEDGERLPGARYSSARAPRLMPESIYEIAGNDRDEAIRLLARFGYIL